MIEINLDGKPVSVPEGSVVMHAADAAGFINHLAEFMVEVIDERSYFSMFLCRYFSIEKYIAIAIHDSELGACAADINSYGERLSCR